MVSMRGFCYLLIYFIFQVHAKVSNANLNSQVTEAADSKGVGARTSMQIADKVFEDIIKHRKVLNQVNVKVEAKKKNGLEIESKETVRKRNNKKKKKLAKTTSLTADYSNPGHHPPRHN